MAPLKLGIWVGMNDLHRYFHERALVAPLKPFLFPRARGARLYFHERALVAPLKPKLKTIATAHGRISTSARSWPH